MGNERTSHPRCGSSVRLQSLHSHTPQSWQHASPSPPRSPPLAPQQSTRRASPPRSRLPSPPPPAPKAARNNTPPPTPSGAPPSGAAPPASGAAPPRRYASSSGGVCRRSRSSHSLCTWYPRTVCGGARRRRAGHGLRPRRPLSDDPPFRMDVRSISYVSAAHVLLRMHATTRSEQRSARPADTRQRD